MKTGIQKIVIASVMLLAQTFSMHAASNAQNLKNEAGNLVAALSNWRTGHPNSIFMSHAAKGNTRSKNILDGDNFIIMKTTKDAKTGAVIQQPKLAWADTLNRVDQFIQANAGNNQTIQTALNTCIGANNMILKMLMQANKLKDNDKVGKIILMNSSSPILKTETNAPSAESVLATLKKAANTLSPSWFGKIKDSEKTKAAKAVTLALIHVLEDALNHIIADFKKFKLVAQPESNTPLATSTTTKPTSTATKPVASKPTTPVPAVKVQPKPATKQEPNVVAKPTSSAKPALDLEAQKTQLDYEMQTTSTAINRNLVKIQDGKKVDFNQLKNELNQWKKLTATPNAGPLSFVEQHTKNKDLLSIVAECKEINNTLVAHIQNIIDFKLDPSFDVDDEKENEAKQALLVKIENVDPERSIGKITPKSFKTKAEKTAYYIAHAFSIRLTTLVESVALIREFPE